MRYEALQKAFEARAAGASLQEVAVALGCTKQGAWKVLRNPKYVKDGTVTQAEFNAAQRPRLPARPYAPRTNSRASTELLAGLVYCAGCARRMTVGGKRQYACPWPGCPAPASVLVSRLDDHVAVTRYHSPHWRELDVLERWNEDALSPPAAKRAIEAIQDETRSRAPKVSEEQVEQLRQAAPDRTIVWLDGRAYLYTTDADYDRDWIRSAVERITVARADPRGRHQPLERRVSIDWITPEAAGGISRSGLRL
jgi:hypothetical protein